MVIAGQRELEMARQIAARMHLAEKTVKNYVSRLLGRLGMERRTQAAVYAAKTANRDRRR